MLLGVKFAVMFCAPNVLNVRLTLHVLLLWLPFGRLQVAPLSVSVSLLTVTLPATVPLDPDTCT